MRNVLNRTILIALFSFFAFIGAAHAQKASSEGCDDYAKADAELNKVYAKVLREYAKDKVFVAKLRTAQRAWISFTTAHLASLYPNAAATYGSVNRSCRCQVLADLTRERILQLQKWLDGAEEGEVCAGSIKRKEER